MIFVALALNACTIPGGVVNSDTDTSSAKDAGADVGDPAAPPQMVKQGEDQSASAKGHPPSDGNSIHHIVPGDELKIVVDQVEELSSEGRVKDNGAIVLPLIGAVQVGGLTLKEAEQRIAEILAKDYLQDPKVSVTVAE